MNKTKNKTKQNKTKQKTKQNKKSPPRTCPKIDGEDNQTIIFVEANFILR